MRERRYRALCVLALALPLCALLRESLFGGKVLCQADHLLSFPPWSEVAPPDHVPGNPVLEDQSILTVPWLGFAAERIRAGELPLWNPHNYGGQPIHAVGSGAFLWPVHFLYYLFPTLGFYAWSALLRLLAAGLFMLLFLRRIGVSRTAALPGAGAFMLSGFLIAWLNHPHSNVALLLPAVLWAVERIAARPRWSEAGVFGLVYGLQLLGGHLQTSLHLTLVLAAWCLFRTRVAVGETRLGGAGWGRLVAGGALGCLLAAPQILPFLEYVGHESQGAIVLETEEQTAELDLLDAAAVMVAPGIHGSPHTHDYTGPEGRNINYNEIVGGYVGRLTLVLALVGAIGVLRDRRALFLACMAVVAALVAWQVWPFHDVVRAIPRLRSTNTTRLLLVVAFGLAALGAIGVDALRERLRLEGRSAAALGLACFAVTAGELVAFGDGYNPAIEPELAYPPTPVTDFLATREGPYRAEGVHRTTLRASANLPYGISKLSGYDKIEFRPMTQLALLLTTGEVVGPFHSEIDVIDRMEALPLASLLGIRFLIAEEDLPPPLELAYTSPGGLRVYENPGALPRAFVARGFVVLEDEGARLAHLGAADMDPSIVVLHRRPDPAAPGEEGGVDELAGTVEIERYEPREVVLRAAMERPGMVVLADAFHPGWTATVAGEDVEIERVDHALRGVWLEAGVSRVEMRYEPASMRWGLVLGTLALLSIGALLGFGRRCR